MDGGFERRSEFGSLERWTVGLLAATFLFSVFTWVPALVCLSYSRCWTFKEKLVAVLVPVALACLLVGYFTYGDAAQNWIRIPLMLTVSGVLPSFSAIYLYAHIHSPWPSNA